MLGPDVVHGNLTRLGRLMLAAALACAAAHAMPGPGGGKPGVEKPPPDTRRGGDGVGGIEKTNGQSSGPSGAKGSPTTGPGPTFAATAVPGDGLGTDLGGGLPGGSTPVLAASGGTGAGETLALQVSKASPLAPAALILGTSAANVPFKGGTLVPAPELLVPGLVMDAQGQLALQAQLPDALPAGLTLFVQLWTADPLGPQGFAASNALEITFP